MSDRSCDDIAKIHGAIIRFHLESKCLLILPLQTWRCVYWSLRPPIGAKILLSEKYMHCIRQSRDRVVVCCHKRRKLSHGIRVYSPSCITADEKKDDWNACYRAGPANLHPHVPGKVDLLFESLGIATYDVVRGANDDNDSSTCGQEVGV
jgi:hypothetical protein